MLTLGDKCRHSSDWTYSLELWVKSIMMQKSKAHLQRLLFLSGHFFYPLSFLEMSSTQGRGERLAVKEKRNRHYTIRCLSVGRKKQKTVPKIWLVNERIIETKTFPKPTSLKYKGYTTYPEIIRKHQQHPTVIHEI